ncbi:uracil-DNA glycosylase [Isoptericola jiangsuensis]|uniref:uracil-DNA glycosylase n=1 Tax=Isoptericola jiangsuensis TaxID=548579 RepID=UPI003AAF0B30
MRDLPDPDDDTYPALVRGTTSLPGLDRHLVACRACPRLVAWREEVATTKRAAYRDETYWARPVPGFGDPQARVVVVGLAPAAHGANRTGRMFTGDRSGDVLFAALHRAGLADQATSSHVDDGLTLTGVRVTSPVHCAPPDNRPTPAERRRCAPYLDHELALVSPTARVLVVLGAFGWQATLEALRGQGWAVPVPRPRFAHGTEVAVTHPGGRRDLTLLGCYHVSQQNTFTGRLTPAMLDDVLARAVELAAT